jgi:hypothetical protein
MASQQGRQRARTKGTIQHSTTTPFRQLGSEIEHLQYLITKASVEHNLGELSQRDG